MPVTFIGKGTPNQIFDPTPTVVTLDADDLPPGTPVGARIVLVVRWTGRADATATWSDLPDGWTGTPNARNVALGGNPDVHIAALTGRYIPAQFPIAATLTCSGLGSCHTVPYVWAPSHAHPPSWVSNTNYASGTSANNQTPAPNWGSLTLDDEGFIVAFGSVRTVNTTSARRWLGDLSVPNGFSDLDDDHSWVGSPEAPAMNLRVAARSSAVPATFTLPRWDYHLNGSGSARAVGLALRFQTLDPEIPPDGPPPGFYTGIRFGA